MEFTKIYINFIYINQLLADLFNNAAYTPELRATLICRDYLNGTSDAHNSDEAQLMISKVSGWLIIESPIGWCFVLG